MEVSGLVGIKGGLTSLVVKGFCFLFLCFCVFFIFYSNKDAISLFPLKKNKDTTMP